MVTVSQNDLGDRRPHFCGGQGPEIDVFALDFLRVLLAYVMLLDIDMPLIGPPSVGVILGDAKGL